MTPEEPLDTDSFTKLLDDDQFNPDDEVVIKDTIKNAMLVFTDGYFNGRVAYVINGKGYSVQTAPASASHAYAYSSSECYRIIKEDFNHEGDVTIGVFFPVHTMYTVNKVPHPYLPNIYNDFNIQYNFKIYQLVLAMVYAIEEINRNPHLLPNISLGFDFYNVPYSEKNILMNSLIWLTGLSRFQSLHSNYNCVKERKSIAAITGPSWAKSAHIGTLLQLYKFPQLTVGPFEPLFSDQCQFTSLYQMAPQGTNLSLAMVSLMLHFGWTWVGLLITDDHRGTHFLADIRKKMEKNQVCIAFVEMIQSTWNSFSYKYWKTLELLPRHIFDMVMNEDSYNTYKAVYTVAHSLHEMSLQQVQMQPFGNGERMVFSPWQLHPFLRNIHMGANMALEWKQKLDDDKYDILNFWNFPKGLGLKVKVGNFLPNAPQSQQLTLSEKMIRWPERYSEIPHSVCSESCGPGFRKVSMEVKAVCCYDCTPCADNEISNETDMEKCMKCPESHYAETEKKHCLQKAVSFLNLEDPLGMSLTTIALCLSVLTTFVLGLFLKHRDTPIVKANNRTLSYTLLITLTVCFLCSLLFIGHPNTTTCILQQITFGGAFTVALATVLAKAITVVIAFKVTFPRRVVRWLIVSKAPNFIIPICTLIHLVLCGIWLGTSPPFLDQDYHAERGHIILVCNKGSDFAFHGILGYLCSLALGSFTMAFMSRNLPDTFNEAKFLSFSMLVFFCVWVTFLPVYHSTKGKIMVAMEVFSILASSAALLGFIFVPKCYIILIRRDKNSVHHIRNRPHSRRNNTLKT
nr:vomeronasal type-2 receptor 116-like [Peromyscus maniculatus bairdii]